jgi:transcriptional regulator GlxA family with amidase domain
MIPVSAIARVAGVGERQLENLFKKYIGLSPKFYSRIIRFNYIFSLVRENHQSWSGLAYEASFFDQSHFIRNFRDFTGENPSDYAFDEKNLANFFLHKK